MEPLVTAWLNSPSHARNILNGYFTEIGIGVASGKIDGQETTVVAMFVARPITPVLETIIAQKEQEVIKSSQETPSNPPIVPPVAKEEILGENTSSEPLLQEEGIQGGSEQAPGDGIPQEGYLQGAPAPNKLFVVQKIENTSVVPGDQPLAAQKIIKAYLK